MGSYLLNNDNGEVRPIILWKTAKAVIRREIISYATWKKNNARKEINEIKKEVERLQREHENTGHENIRMEFKEMKNKLDTLLTGEIEKALVFTRQKYYDNSPKALKLLAFKLKKQKEQAIISKIKGENSDYLNEKS